MTPEPLVERAMSCFLEQRLTCGEALVQAGCDTLGVDASVVTAAAFGFCGGVGRQGQLCGAIAGGAMVISLARKQQGEAVLDAVGALHAEMLRRHGDCSCRGLCKLDLTKGADRLQFQVGAREERCAPIVREVATLVAEQVAALRTPETR